MQLKIFIFLILLTLDIGASDDTGLPQKVQGPLTTTNGTITVGTNTSAAIGSLANGVTRDPGADYAYAVQNARGDNNGTGVFTSAAEQQAGTLTGVATPGAPGGEGGLAHGGATAMIGLDGLRLNAYVPMSDIEGQTPMHTMTSQAIGTSTGDATIGLSERPDERRSGALQTGSMTVLDPMAVRLESSGMPSTVAWQTTEPFRQVAIGSEVLITLNSVEGLLQGDSVTLDGVGTYIAGLINASSKTTLVRVLTSVVEPYSSGVSTDGVAYEVGLIPAGTTVRFPNHNTENTISAADRAQSVAEASTAAQSGLNDLQSISAETNIESNYKRYATTYSYHYATRYDKSSGTAREALESMRHIAWRVNFNNCVEISGVTSQFAQVTSISTNYPRIAIAEITGGVTPTLGAINASNSTEERLVNFMKPISEGGHDGFIDINLTLTQVPVAYSYAPYGDARLIFTIAYKEDMSGGTQVWMRIPSRAPSWYNPPNPYPRWLGDAIASSFINRLQTIGQIEPPSVSYGAVGSNYTAPTTSSGERDYNVRAQVLNNSITGPGVYTFNTSSDPLVEGQQYTFYIPAGVVITPDMRDIIINKLIIASNTGVLPTATELGLAPVPTS